MGENVLIKDATLDKKGASLDTKKGAKLGKKLYLKNDANLEASPRWRGNLLRSVP